MATKKSTPRVAPTRAKAAPPLTPGSRAIAVSDFKARCLRLVDEINATGQEYVITKRGAPVALVTPLRSRRERTLGRWKGLVEEAGDIVAVDWAEEFEALRGP